MISIINSTSAASASPRKLGLDAALGGERVASPSKEFFCSLVTDNGDIRMNKSSYFTQRQHFVELAISEGCKADLAQPLGV